jgi:hypothetical protein
MPINKNNIIFIGNAGGICGYLSHGLNIIRKSSSLTSKRVAEESAFEGFRNSGNRMKQASPIAASLYNLLSKEQKVYTIYRTLTGEALKMIKLGMEVELIVSILKEQYIDPILKGAVNSKNRLHGVQPKSGRSNDTKKPAQLNSNLFKTIPYNREEKRRVRVNRTLQYAESGVNQIGHTELQYSNEIALQQHRSENTSFQPAAFTRKQKRVSRFSAFVYMGRLKECKGLRMWRRPII